MNSLAGAYVVAQKRRCGIPQGCPLSMCVIAFFLRPWLLQMERLGAMPRTLADDVLLLTKGGRALNLFHEAFNQTIQHLYKLCGRVAPAKSLVFVTVSHHRQWLKRHVWVPLRQGIIVVFHFRDLGAQFNATHKISTTQSKVRLADGLHALHSMGRLPHERHYKTQFAVAYANKKGLIQL